MISEKLRKTLIWLVAFAIVIDATYIIAETVIELVDPSGVQNENK